ncbi:MAG: hypothetical protein QXL89_03675 [Nitrososphaeria archaeon]
MSISCNSANWPNILPGASEGDFTLTTGTALVIAGITCLALAAVLKRR